jgi:transposase InsO family protein
MDQHQQAAGWQCRQRHSDRVCGQSSCCRARLSYHRLIRYANVPEARASIGKYLDFYNGKRPHQSLGRQTPDQDYFNALQPIPVAA